jgi:transposase
MGYSLDLRKRVVEAVANGESKQSVAKRYNV